VNGFTSGYLQSNHLTDALGGSLLPRLAAAWRRRSTVGQRPTLTGTYGRWVGLVTR